MQVERYPFEACFEGESGERVSNTWIICLWVGDNCPKGQLIPNEMVITEVAAIKGGDRKAYRLEMSPRLIS